MFRPTLAICELPGGGLSVRATRHRAMGGQVTYRDIPNLSAAQLKAWLDGNRTIQDVLGHLSTADREFLLTGINT